MKNFQQSVLCEIRNLLNELRIIFLVRIPVGMKSKHLLFSWIFPKFFQAQNHFKTLFPISFNHFSAYISVSSLSLKNHFPKSSQKSECFSFCKCPMSSLHIQSKIGKKKERKRRNKTGFRVVSPFLEYIL